MKKSIFKNNPVKKNMDKFHKPRTHKDKTKYDRKSESEKLQDQLEPIFHPTEYDESDDLEDAKSVRTGDMIPTLVKAIQELEARIATLET